MGRLHGHRIGQEGNAKVGRAHSDTICPRGGCKFDCAGLISGAGHIPPDSQRDAAKEWKHELIIAKALEVSSIGQRFAPFAGSHMDERLSHRLPSAITKTSTLAEPVCEGEELTSTGCQSPSLSSKTMRGNSHCRELQEDLSPPSPPELGLHRRNGPSKSCLQRHVLNTSGP